MRLFYDPSTVPSAYVHQNAYEMLSERLGTVDRHFLNFLLVRLSFALPALLLRCDRGFSIMIRRND